MNNILTSLAKFEIEIFKHYKKYTDPRNTEKCLYVDTSKMTKDGDTFFEYKDEALGFLKAPIKIGAFTFERINNDIKIKL
jgi:hypothetical protein